MFETLRSLFTSKATTPAEVPAVPAPGRSYDHTAPAVAPASLVAGAAPLTQPRRQPEASAAFRPATEVPAIDEVCLVETPAERVVKNQVTGTIRTDRR